MRIGLLGEDNMHDAVLRGLSARWCPRAEMETGQFRGRTKKRRRAELRHELTALMRAHKCSCAAILLDADNDKWKDKVENERSKLPEEYVHLTAIGAPERNVECWLTADLDHFCSVTGADRERIEAARRTDPKGEVRSSLERAAHGSKKVHDYAVGFVAGAPLSAWLRMNCFKAFYDECRGLATTLGCSLLPNEADARARTDTP